MITHSPTLHITALLYYDICQIVPSKCSSVHIANRCCFPFLAIARGLPRCTNTEVIVVLSVVVIVDQNKSQHLANAGDC